MHVYAHVHCTHCMQGEALGWVDMRGLLALQRETVRRGASHYVLNGIAYDDASDTLLVTGKQWDHIYQVRLVPHPAPHTDVREACFGYGRDALSRSKTRRSNSSQMRCAGLPGSPHSEPRT